MITQIKGRLVEKNLTNVVIDCHGVGYYINISLNTHSQIGNSEELLLFTHLHIKEDSHTLYGFVTQNERSIFRLLISISGIGPSIARTMLSSMDPHEIQKSILGENLEAIKSIKGIGLKTAQRVLIELTNVGFTRENAYKIVQKNAMKSWNDNSPFYENIANDKKITNKIPVNKLKKLFNFSYHTKKINIIFNRSLKK